MLTRKLCAAAATLFAAACVESTPPYVMRPTAPATGGGAGGMGAGSMSAPFDANTAGASGATGGGMGGAPGGMPAQPPVTTGGMDAGPLPDAAASDGPAMGAGGSPGTGGSGGTGAQRTPDAGNGFAARDTAPGSPTPPRTPPMMCAGGTTLRSFDKSCREDADCVAVRHQINCCGTEIAMGINKNELAAFNEAEKPCATAFPVCDCATEATRTDDGSPTAPNVPSTVAVACRAGVCTTYARSCGAPCGGGTSCFCCASGPTNTCACAAACMSNGDCKDPALPVCQTRGGFCTRANVTCGVP